MVKAAVITVAAIYCSCVEYSIAAKTPTLVDTNATPETKSLFLNLKKLAKDKVLFGHQHTTCYGVGWKGGDKRSDVKDVTGSFPAVYGWDMGYVKTDRHAKLIIDAFERGGINTISWHMKHPITGGNCKATKHQAVHLVVVYEHRDVGSAIRTIEYTHSDVCNRCSMNNNNKPMNPYSDRTVSPQHAILSTAIG